MFSLKRISDQITGLVSSRRSSTTTTTRSDETMGNKASTIYPPGSPAGSGNQGRVQGGRVSKITARGGRGGARGGARGRGGITGTRGRARGGGRATAKTRNTSSAESDDQSMAKTESDGGIEVDPDLDMGGDEDFGSHHSDQQSEDPSDESDKDSDAESHLSGIGSDRFVHTDPNELYEPEREYFDDEMPGDTKVDFFLDVQGKIRMGNRDRSDWHEAEIALFDELDLRGTQPLLPAEWSGDFPTCPPILFSDVYEKTYLNSMSTDEFAGARALRELVVLGSKARSVMTGSRTRERVIEIGVNEYHKWAQKDGNYWNKKYEPILVVTAGKPGQNINEITQLQQTEMQHLASLHRKLMLQEEGDDNHPPLFHMEPPLIYGIMIVGTIVVFVTLDSRCPDDIPRTIAHFNFDDPTMDVWNSFAIAILITATRDWMSRRLEDWPAYKPKRDLDR